MYYVKIESGFLSDFRVVSEPNPRPFVEMAGNTLEWQGYATSDRDAVAKAYAAWNMLRGN